MRNVSKKVIGGYVCLVLLMVVLFGTLNGNDSQAESFNGKQWAEPGGYLKSLDGVKNVLFGKETEFSSLESSWLSVLDSEEPLISCKWTYIEGTKQSKEFIEFKSYDEYLGNVLLLRRRNITEQGKAIYHIVAESEHYYTEFDTTLVFIPSSRVVVTLPGSVINIPIGTYDYLDMDFISEYSYSTFLTMENEPNEVNEEYELSYQCLTIKKPGDYQLLMELRADYGDGLYLTVPVTVHSDNSISEISFSGDPVAVTVEGVNTIENGDYEPGLVILSDSEETESSTDSTFSDASVSLDDDDSPTDSTFSDAFASLDDLDDESDGNTDSLDDFDSPANTPEPENNLEELTKEDTAVLIADEIVNAMNSSEFVPVQKEVFLERDTELQRNGMFVWPLPEGFSLMKSNEESIMAGNIPCDIKSDTFSDETGLNFSFSQVNSYNTLGYMDNADLARSIYQEFYNSWNNTNKMKVVSAQEIMLDGNYPAYACVATTYRVSNSGKTYQQVICNLWYPRGNNTVFYLNYYMYSGVGIRYEDATLPTVEDFMPLLSQVSYSMPENREGIQDWLITKDDLEMSMSAKPDQYLLNAGGSMRFSVEYRNPALIKKMKNLQKTAWLVVDPEAMANGQVLTIDPSIATLDQNGNLKAGNVQEPVEVQVIAFSSNASTIQSRIVTLLPKMNKISVNEANVTMYVGDSMKLTGVFEPANAFWYSEKNGGNTAWSVNNMNAISLEDLKDGTAVVQALAAGKASVTLKDILSGKQARSNIQVLAPVEEVTVTGPDTVSPGKRAAYKAVIAPQNAGNKKVSWMVDVDESVATIDKNGNLAVNKAAEAGTSITITCTAEGAAVEVSTAKTITVQ